MRVARSRLEARLRARGYSAAATEEAVQSSRAWLDVRLDAVRRRKHRVVRGSALVAFAPGRIELRPMEVSLPGPNELTVELSVSAVSPGTERAQYLRLPNAQVAFPFRPGYSGAGRVIAAGRNVRGFARGDAVAVPRVSHASVATVAAGSVYHMPPGVRMEDAALVYLGMIAGYGLRRAEIESGTPVGIVGYGTIGALAQRLAVVAGAGATTVIAATRARERLARAGGARSFLSADEDVTGLGLPVVLEATGDPSALVTAVAAAGQGARIVLLGSSRGVGELPLADIRRKRLELVGAHISALAVEARRNGNDPFRELAEEFLGALADGRLRVDDLVNLVVDPRESSAFYRRLATDPSVVGARFDWSLLSQEERPRTVGLFARPRLDLSGRDPEGAVLPALPEPSKAAAARRRRGDELRVGLLGCGEIGVQNARALAQAEGVELAACFDPVDALARDVADRFGGVVYRSPEDLFGATGLGAVLIATPHHLHAPLALEAIDAGLHVIVEKPLALNSEEGRSMVAAADARGVLLSTCFPYRYEAHVVAARRLVEAGALGSPSGVLVNYGADKPPSYSLGGYSSRALSPWRASRRQAGGGVVIMNLCHYLDLVRHVANLEAETVTARVDRLDEEDAVEDTAAVAITYTNGAIGSIFGSSVARGSAFSELRLWGDAGHVLLEPQPRLYTLRALSGLTAGRWHELPTPGPENVRTIYVERFAEAVQNGSPPDISGDDGLAVQALMDAVYESATSGAAVRTDKPVDPVRA